MSVCLTSFSLCCMNPTRVSMIIGPCYLQGRAKCLHSLLQEHGAVLCRRMCVHELSALSRGVEDAADESGATEGRWRGKAARCTDDDGNDGCLMIAPRIMVMMPG